MLDNPKILVVARERAFWSTDVFNNYFSRKITLKPYAKYEEIPVFIKVLFSIFLKRPNVIIFGTTLRMLKWFIVLKPILFKDVKIITDDQQLNDKHAKQIERIITYSHEEVDRFDESLKDRFMFMHYPSKKGLVSIKDSKKGDYVFCGGNNMRDHKSFFEAMKGMNIPAKVVTDCELPKDVPENIEVFEHLPLEDYIQMMNDSRFIVVPLLKSKMPHGHCDISAALSVGKVVITTKSATASDYIQDDKEGILVNPGDVDAYKWAIEKLWTDDKYRKILEKNVEAQSENITYETFLKRLNKEIENFLL